jgi:hypothetical protein
MKVPRLHFSRALVLAIGGVLVFCGASGAAAVYIGADRLLGPSYADLNGLECTAIQTTRFRRDGNLWVRKYVTTEKRADGITRVRTALRVAQAVQKREKADLVQVTLVDPAGPQDRALMRGRTIGAQAVYIPDLSKMPEGAASHSYAAYYHQGTANDAGEYYGLRIDLPFEDIAPITAALTDNADCVNPVTETPADGHGAPATAHGEPVSGHGDGAADSHGGAAAEHHGAAEISHEEQASEGQEAASEDHGDQSAEHASVEPAEGEGFLAKLKSMVLGGGDGDAGHDPEDSSAPEAHDAGPPAAEDAHAEPPAHEAGANAARTAAETAAEDHGKSDEPAVEEPQPSVAEGATEADAAGAEWLAKLRGEKAQEVRNETESVAADKH